MKDVGNNAMSQELIGGKSHMIMDVKALKLSFSQMHWFIPGSLANDKTETFILPYVK